MRRRPSKTGPTGRRSSPANQAQLKKGDKALVGNSAHRRYLRTTAKKAFKIDPGKFAGEGRLNGVTVLRINSKITTLQATHRRKETQRRMIAKVQMGCKARFESKRRLTW